MPRALPISNDYPADWPEINQRVVDAAGRRCIRCGHPYVKGEHGRGEWTPCDEKCTHGQPIAFMGHVSATPFPIPDTEPAGKLVRKYECGFIVAQWRILTVHHLSGDKADCHWSNLLALCQRCHLQIQGKVNPQIPYFLEHSEWFKPYAAAFYARKYLKQFLTREEVMARLDELLALERLA